MQIEAYSGRWKAQKSGGRVVARLEFLVLETAGDLVMLESRTEGHDDLGGSGALDPRGRPMIGGPMDSSVRLFARTRLEDWEENILRVVEDKRPSSDRPVPLELPARGIKILRPTGSGSAR